MHRLALLLVVAVGCDDEIFEPCVAPGAYTPDWPGVAAFVDDNCVACHSAQNPVILPGDIIEDIENGPDVRAHEGTDMELIVPHEPQLSLIWLAINQDREDDSPVGPMPLGSGPLCPATTKHVGEWIERGAPLGTDDTDVSDTDGGT